MTGDPGDDGAVPARRSRRFVATVVGVALLLVGGVAGIAATSGSSAAGYDTKADAFVLPALDGHGEVKLASFVGKPLVVNFFASWCSGCREELPGFAAEARALRGKVDFVEVDALETGNGLAFAKRLGLYGAVSAVARDVGGAQGSGLYQAEGGVDTMPWTEFYGTNGVSLFSVPVALGRTQLAAEVHRLYGVSPRN